MTTRWLATAGLAMAVGFVAPHQEAQAGVRVSGTIVVTSGGDHGYRGDRRDGVSAFRHGYDRGWRDGSREGSRDGRRNRDPRFWREDDFRDADNGYKRWMGPRSEYARGYREGYRSGYRRAYATSRPGWRGGWDDHGRHDRRRDDGRRDGRREDWSWRDR